MRDTILTDDGEIAPETGDSPTLTEIEQQAEHNSTHNHHGLDGDNSAA